MSIHETKFATCLSSLDATWPDQCNELQLTNISCKEKRLHNLEKLQGGIFSGWIV